MSFLDDHRRAVTDGYEIFPLGPPFSFFDFIETRFGGRDSIRRLFSLARSFACDTLIVESLHAAGIIAEENEDILVRYPDHQNPSLLRLSFWKRKLAGSSSGLPCPDTDKLIGYAILKHDLIPTAKIDHWHAFEAVFEIPPRAQLRPSRQGISSHGLRNTLHH